MPSFRQPICKKLCYEGMIRDPALQMGILFAELDQRQPADVGNEEPLQSGFGFSRQIRPEIGVCKSGRQTAGLGGGEDDMLFHAVSDIQGSDTLLCGLYQLRALGFQRDMHRVRQQDICSGKVRWK